MQSHAEKVQVIRNQIKKFYREKKKVRIYHGSTNSTRVQKFKRNEMIDVSELNQVLEVNTKQKYVIVEPNIKFGQLVKETLKYGLTPPVIPEFPNISVGGAINGGAGESGSFKWGGVVTLEYELVLVNGDCITVSPSKNSDLYWGTGCSYGSLGILTSVKLLLIPAKKYVQLTYHRVKNYEEASLLLQKVIKEDVDFVDGILFSKNLGTIMVGKLSDKNNLPVSKFHTIFDEWFTIHAEKITKKYKKYDELIPIYDYFFRYDRAGYWVGRYVFDEIKLPFNRLTRILLNPLMETKTLYRCLQAINVSQKFVVQDMLVPIENLVNFINFVNKTTNVYPLWLLPIKTVSKGKLYCNYNTSKLIVDCGTWGRSRVRKWTFEEFININRNLERMLTKLGGRKVLYAHQYFPKEEFWKIYDWNWYDKLRRRYNADNVFPDVWEKTHVSERYKPSIVRGLWNVLKSPFKLPVAN